jgi:catechol 2,3-dioxygenase-like lactoylglutathione lyase family enzyme
LTQPFLLTPSTRENQQREIAMAIRKLDHVNIRTADLAATRRFYTEVMGMTDGYRPPFDFPGIWLYAGEAPVIHVTDISKGSPRHPADGHIPEGTGMVDHIAFFGDDVDALRARLNRSQLRFEERVVPRNGILQVFFRDPNGILIEVNHAAAAPAPRERATVTAGS